MSEYDRDILKAISGFSRKSPQDLPGILATVDAFQRMILSHDELASGLARLIEAGKVAEAGNYRYYAPKSPPSVRSFSGVPLEEYDRACKAYNELFAAALEELNSRRPSPEDKTRQKIVVRWCLPVGAFPTESDEDAIEPLIERISRTLEADGRAEVIGCEHGSGHIDVLIFGKETDADTDDIYTMIRPIVAGFACPPGSCIIRQYEEPQREVTSDLVPGD
jgi:hypothetical protein